MTELDTGALDAVFANLQDFIDNGKATLSAEQVSGLKAMLSLDVGVLRRGIVTAYKQGWNDGQEEAAGSVAEAANLAVAAVVPDVRLQHRLLVEAEREEAFRIIEAAAYRCYDDREALYEAMLKAIRLIEEAPFAHPKLTEAQVVLIDAHRGASGGRQ